jgi:hypothetical protein
MSNYVNEESVRQYIRELKMFYKEVLVSVSVFAVCLIAWLATGGSCWPIWVFVALSAKLLIRAISIGRISIWEVKCFGKWLSFLRPEWEEQQIKKIMNFNEQDSSKKSSIRNKHCAKCEGDSFEENEARGGQKKGPTYDKNAKRDEVSIENKSEDSI